MKVCAVYEIVSLDTGEKYVGSTIDMAHRMYNHQWHFRKGTHRNYPMARAYKRHGWEGFKVNILETCTPENVRVCEQKYLDAGQHGYNLSNISEGSVMSEDGRQRVAAYNQKRGLRFDGKLLSEWAKIKGVRTWTIYQRVARGWTFEEAINTPANRRHATGHLVTFNGETLSQNSMAPKYGLSPETLRRRLKAGLSVETALTRPSRNRNKHVQPSL